MKLNNTLVQGLKTLTPRLVGQSAELRMRKRFETEKLDESTFLEHLDPEYVKFYQELLKFSKDRQLTIKWGTKSFFSKY